MNHVSETVRKRNLRILLLDDNDHIRTTLTKLLTRRGYEVFSFSKPTVCPLHVQPECRCNHDQTCTDAILTDVDMPEMDGLRFLEIMKAKNCKCRNVGVMSGGLNNQTLSRAKALGCKVFAKPFSHECVFDWLNGIEKNIKPYRQLCNWLSDQ